MKDEIDIIFKQEQTNFAIKTAPLELQMNLQADFLDVKSSPAFMKHILEFYNYYKFAVSKASVKHKIFNQIQDPTFLMDNIIENTKFSKELVQELEVIAIYEFETNLDHISTKFNVA